MLLSRTTSNPVNIKDARNNRAIVFKEKLSQSETLCLPPFSPSVSLIDEEIVKEETARHSNFRRAKTAERQFLTAKHNRNLKSGNKKNSVSMRLQQDAESKRWQVMDLFYSGKANVKPLRRKSKQMSEASSDSSMSDVEPSQPRRRNSGLAKRVWSSIHSLLQVDDKTRKFSSLRRKSKSRNGSVSRGMSNSLPSDLNKLHQTKDFSWILLERVERKEIKSEKARLPVSKKIRKKGKTGKEKELVRSITVDSFLTITDYGARKLSGVSPKMKKKFSINAEPSSCVVIHPKTVSEEQRKKTNLKTQKLNSNSSSLENISSKVRCKNQTKRKFVLTRVLFDDLKNALQNKLANFLREKTYNHNEVAEWCQILCKSIKDRVVGVTEDSYKVASQVFIGAVHENGLHSAALTSCSFENDRFFTVTFRGEDLFALASITAIKASTIDDDEA